MKFLDKGGALRMRYVPLFVGSIAFSAAAYGAGLSVGPAAGLVFLGFINFVILVGFAILWDRVERHEHLLGERGLG